MNRKKCIVLIGPPCSGKSSIGKAAAEILNSEYISSGDIAREMAKHDDNIKNNLNMGKMAPEARMRELMYESLFNALDYNDIIIVDGFPRNGDQAKWLRNVLPIYVDIKYVRIHVPKEIIKLRASKRGREDDVSITNRYKYYIYTTLHELHTKIDKTIQNNVMELCVQELINYIVEV